MMTVSRRFAAVAVVGSIAAAAIAVAGASTAAGPTATAVDTSVAGSPAFDAVDFFTDLFGGINADPHRQGDLPQRVVAGSSADAFVTYLFGFGSAREASRQGPLEQFTVSGDETSVEVCNEGFCDTFSEFVVTGGRLESFLLNGIDIDGRLAAPSKAIEHGRPVRVRVVGAFERVTVDELAVVLAIEADEDITVAWDESAYVDQSWGRIDIDLVASAFPPTITSGDEHEVVLQFPTALLGGDVVLSYTTAASAEPAGLRIDVDELGTP
jgi:hypothetical protein